MVYLICYDIVNDRRRTKVAQLLCGYGLRVQKSVFECDLEERQLAWLEQALLKQVNLAEDQIRVYPLSKPCRQKVKVLGLQPSYRVDDAAFIV